jgi:hypothetical protein
MPAKPAPPREVPDGDPKPVRSDGHTRMRDIDLSVVLTSIGLFAEKGTRLSSRSLEHAFFDGRLGLLGQAI